MPWDAGPGAGFTTGRPWLPLGPDHTTVNVAAQRRDPGSMLWLHRRLLALRRRAPALAGGGYQPVAADGDVLAYLRDGSGARYLVALNLGPEPARLALPAGEGRVAVGTDPARDGDRVAGTLALAGDEGLVLAWTGRSGAGAADTDRS
jgi:alpha-glucosidase